MSRLPDVRLLELFDQLYETRSVTRSAERLGLAQPTASIWLSRLRSQLGDRLFVRTSAGMAPTPGADAMIGPCREILDALRRLGSHDLPFDPQQARRRFRVAMSDASHVTLLPDLLGEVRALAPGIRLDVAPLGTGTESAMESGTVDLAIGHAPWLGRSLHRQRLFDQDWVCVATANHPRLRGTVTRARFVTEGHVNVAAGTGSTLLDQALADQRIERRVVLDLPGFLGLGRILGATDLLATLPRHIGETLAGANGLAVHSCPVPVPGFSVYQHWHGRYHDEPGVHWLRDLVARLFQR